MNRGFPSGRLSVDRTDEQFLTLANLFYEGRIELYDYKPFREEFFDLLHDRTKGKVDHPEGSCLLPWVKVHLLDGRDIKVSDLDKEEKIQVITINSRGKVWSHYIRKAWQTGSVTSYIHVELSNNKSFDVTENHLVMLDKGSYCRAQDLEEGVALMSFHLDFNGWYLRGRKRVWDKWYSAWRYTDFFTYPYKAFYCRNIHNEGFKVNFFGCLKCLFYIGFSFSTRLFFI